MLIYIQLNAIIDLFYENVNFQFQEICELNCWNCNENDLNVKVFSVHIFYIYLLFWIPSVDYYSLFIMLDGSPSYLLIHLLVNDYYRWQYWPRYRNSFILFENRKIEDIMLFPWQIFMILQVYFRALTVLRNLFFSFLVFNMQILGYLMRLFLFLFFFIFLFSSSGAWMRIIQRLLSCIYQILLS